MQSKSSAAPVRGAILPSGRVILVSNRLPFTARIEGHDIDVYPSSGGVATGLRAIQERCGAVCIGWAGVPTGKGTASTVGGRLASLGSVAVPLEEAEVAGFYRRYSNKVLWPALHGWTEQLRADPDDWITYREINERFASVVAEHLRPGDCLWIHDYHLLLLPRLVRARVPRARIGFFLHTPFPDPATFAAIPQHAELLDGMLGASVIGFHTSDYARFFRNAVAEALPQLVRGGEIVVNRRVVRVCAEPMGVDFGAFNRLAGDLEVSAEVSRIRGESGAAILLGVDRLDYTKGVLQRLLALELLLERQPELRGRVRLIQIAVPTRKDVRAYQDLRNHVEAVVHRINLRFGRSGWTPVEYLFDTVDRSTLVSLYRAADVMLVTPLRDGMNLVAKEFVAARRDGDGVLVLSRHAGAAAELDAALQASPEHIHNLAGVIQAALALEPSERRVRMRRLRKAVASNDFFHWADRFIQRIRLDDSGLPAQELSRRSSVIKLEDARVLGRRAS